MNFEVLEINGLKTSKSSNSTFFESIRSSTEPITLVLRRSSERREFNQIFISARSAANESPTSSPTKTHCCSCGREWIENEQISRQSNQQYNSDRYQYQDFAHHNNSPLPHSNNFPVPMTYQEVKLQRPKKGQKLGITLCDDINLVTNEAKVTVASVACSSEAAKFGKIQTGDVIVKIDDVPVGNMEEAAKVLDKKSNSYSFFIGRPEVRSPINCDNDNQPILLEGRRNHDVCRDVINTITSNDVKLSIPVTTLQFAQNHDVRKESDELKSPVKSPTTEKHPKSFQRIIKYNRSQSLIGNALAANQEQPKQILLQGLPRRSSYGDCLAVKNKNSSRSSIANEDFIYVKPKKYSFAKRVSFSKEHSNSKLCSPQVLTNGSFVEIKNDVSNLAEDVESSHVKQRRNLLSTSTVGDLEDLAAQGLSPWVQIARRDYENKIKQYKKEIPTSRVSSDSKSLSTSAPPGTPTDNTSSAYSTGESFRSSSSNNESRVDGNLSQSCLQHPDHITNFEQETSSSSCYTSSDENSDADNPTCYLSHLEEESISEGFEDARIEFRSYLSSPATCSSRPTPLPRLLNPPRESSNDFKFHSCPSSVDSETNTASKSKQTSDCVSCAGAETSPSPLANSDNSAQVVSSPVPRFSIPTITVSDENLEEAQGSNNISVSNDNTKLEVAIDRNQFRRKSEHALPTRRPFPTQRSISCVESRELRQEDDGSIPMTWKIRIRKDGTRYITKRPVREKCSRQRVSRELDDDQMGSAPTSEDEQTELKLARRWSRDDRKRHVRVAREKKRRRDFMQKRRLEALNENSQGAVEPIVELSHAKMNKHKQKRMLFDNFVTVQELLAHGNRTGDLTKLNPLLSVSYI